RRRPHYPDGAISAATDQFSCRSMRVAIPAKPLQAYVQWRYLLWHRDGAGASRGSTEEGAAIKTQSSGTPRIPTVGSAPWMRRDRHSPRRHATSYSSSRGETVRGSPMTFDGTMTFAESSSEQVAAQ